MSLRDKEGLNSFHVYPSETFEFYTISMYYITYRLTEAVRLHCLLSSVHLLRLHSGEKKRQLHWILQSISALTFPNLYLFNSQVDHLTSSNVSFT